MGNTIPLKRKLEIAVAGYLIDLQKADPTFLPGHTIVCGSTGRSPDDISAPVQGPVIEPDLPYTSVACTTTKERADFPPGYGIKDAVVNVWSKTHASDDSRAEADALMAPIEDAFGDPDVIGTALNQPTVATTPDTRRQKGLYVYSIEDIETSDDHSQTTWEDELVAHLVCQGFDPSYE